MFTVTDKEIQRFINNVKDDLKFRKFVNSLPSTQVQVLNYENLPKQHNNMLRPIIVAPTNYNYKELCINYDYVTNELHKTFTNTK